MRNIDPDTVKSFGDEWSRFNQLAMSDLEAYKIFSEYFAIFPWSLLPESAEGFDMGCGSGRWARWVSPRVRALHCIDPSDAIEVSRDTLSAFKNIKFHRASVGDRVLPPNSQDFGYSLGVLHHVPETASAIRACVDILKPGAPLLLYLYYAFDNRPVWFRILWRTSDFMRRVISRFPAGLKNLISDIIAVTVYWPISRLSSSVEKFGIAVDEIPLSYYRNHTLYTMRTDARDRFGTPLEKRFRRDQIHKMMSEAGLVNIRFSESAPYWCVVGIKDLAFSDPRST